jgi:hypothetical protein
MISVQVYLIFFLIAEARRQPRSTRQKAAGFSRMAERCSTKDCAGQAVRPRAQRPYRRHARTQPRMMSAARSGME